ncbi:MAG: dihydroneopterin aldolase [Rhodospirillales bacterium]|nr:dihydroneopterin aldolase [Rhodospirillales bacterium]MCW8861028.1 dihydroneopterin aldolase [Rhodospirillales bacterium]MCW8952875.1 dihydroneopterin aldolase [Rhodospirillales bacterium]MCW8969930.1 dihydroneopterin aldolase [Rhodospirillales bacterium]MCW9001997.1 dihydroneopterin aldolase [Rhodospirillales bacterium]
MTASTAPVIQPLRIADARASVRHVFIRDLVLDCSIGVHAHEHLAAQPVRINLDLAVSEGDAPVQDRLENVVCYERIADGVRAIVADGHVNLVETLAERIAAMCLQDTRVEAARVRVEKLAVFKDAASVGIEIERFAKSL